MLLSLSLVSFFFPSYFVDWFCPQIQPDGDDIFSQCFKSPDSASSLILFACILLKPFIFAFRNICSILFIYLLQISLFNWSYISVDEEELWDKNPEKYDGQLQIKQRRKLEKEELEKMNLYGFCINLYLFFFS